MYHYILKINSRESNYKVTTNPIQVSFTNTGNSSVIERISVKGASIPNVFYNIRASNNKLTIGSIDVQTVIFPIGQYTINSLINYFNSTLQSSLLGVTMSFDSFINKILITSLFADATFIGAQSNSFHVLGLREGEDYVVLQNVPTHLLYMSDLSGIRNIYVETSFSNMNCLDTVGFKSYGAFIPVDKPFGSIIHYINQEQDLDTVTRSKTYSQNLNRIEIGLRDVEGNLLDLQNMNWEITFKIYLSHDSGLTDY